MSGNNPVYSIQRTYIIKPVSKSENRILTCDERIDIPTIEPLLSVKPPLYEGEPLTVIPCIELAGAFLSYFDLTFETNEGVTVLPVRIAPAWQNPLENPYIDVRYVLVLPIGATGVKSCKLIDKATGKEVQHNFTFGIMPPPYNYDDALFGYFTFSMIGIVRDVQNKLEYLHLITTAPISATLNLPKGEGKQTNNIKEDVVFYNTEFNYNLSSEPTTHKPKITLSGGGRDHVYTLSLNKTKNAVSIDLLTGKLTVYDPNTGEIIQQFMLAIPYDGFNTLSFENFDDINTSYLEVVARGVRVK